MVVVVVVGWLWWGVEGGGTGMQHGRLLPTAFCLHLPLLQLTCFLFVVVLKLRRTPYQHFVVVLAV